MIAEVVRAKPDCVLGLATGSTPIGIYERLAAMNLDFSRVKTFNLDEYVGLPASHPQSYRYFMEEHLFKHINIKPENVNFLNGMAADVDAECARYEALIAANPIDIQLLGIGSNGHIAFNEPGSALESRTRKIALTERTIKDNSRFFGPDEVQPTSALTMGVQTILAAKSIVLVAKGAGKTEAVKKALYSAQSPSCPASYLLSHPRTVFLVDKDVDV